MGDERDHNVVPIGGHRLPPPPGWLEATAGPPPSTTGPGTPGFKLRPEDFTESGRVRCFAVSKQKGERCTKPAVMGTTVCQYHGAGGAIKHPDDPSADTHTGTVARKRVLEAVREHLDTIAEKAVRRLESLLDDESIKPSEALKAIELTLDRSVGKQIAVESVNSAKRDMDAEILELVRNAATGTEG